MIILVTEIRMELKLSSILRAEIFLCNTFLEVKSLAYIFTGIVKYSLAFGFCNLYNLAEIVGTKNKAEKY